MQFPKNPPLKDKNNVEFVKTLRCVVCGMGNVDCHHIVSRGAGGGDELKNLLALCRKHHTEIHAIGRETFHAKYNLVLTYRL